MNNSPPSDYRQNLLKIREDRDQTIVSNPRNWFSLVGLFPLHTGRNTLGTQPGCGIRLPIKAAPLEGVVSVKEDCIYLGLAVDPGMRLNGGALQERQLRVDVEGDPDLLELGPYAMMVIKRGDWYFLRLWDCEASAYQSFKGLRYFNVDPQWKIKATFEQFDPPRVGKMINAIGIESETRYPGFAHFSLSGKSYRLLAEESGEELLFNFTDTTRSDETYPGGRFLEVPRPVGDTLILDFNLARNWPCAYTHFATCPLPPVENHLSIRVEAGEKRYQ